MLSYSWYFHHWPLHLCMKRVNMPVDTCRQHVQYLVANEICVWRTCNSVCEQFVSSWWLISHLIPWHPFSCLTVLLFSNFNEMCFGFFILKIWFFYNRNKSFPGYPNRYSAKTKASLLHAGYFIPAGAEFVPKYFVDAFFDWVKHRHRYTIDSLASVVWSSDPFLANTLVGPPWKLLIFIT